MPLCAWHNSVFSVLRKESDDDRSVAKVCLSAAMWAQQDTAHLTIPFTVQVFHHILKESFPQKTLPSKTFSHKWYARTARPQDGSMNLRRKLSIEHQVASLRNCAYLRSWVLRLCQLKVWSWRNSSLETAWRTSKFLSLSLTPSDLNTFPFLRHCTLCAILAE